ncbi:MAG: VWA domain-containing protein [Gemmatimonadota bacterium]
MDFELYLNHPTPTFGAPLHLQVLLRLKGSAPADTGRTPLNLSLVLDRSGSMQGEKLEYAKSAAALLLRRLAPEDVAGGVAYDDRVEPLPTGTRGAQREELLTAVQALFPRGMTNLSGGWMVGRDQVAESRLNGGVNRVLLMTDGLANRGVTNPLALAELCREAAVGGITTTTIGFGEGFDEDLLRAMADAGGGATYYVENPDQAPGIFEEELLGLMSLGAQNVVVEITPEAGAPMPTLRHDYPTQRQGSTVRVRLGDLYAREPRDLLLDFQLPGDFLGRAEVEGSGVGSVEVARIRIQGAVLTQGGGVETREVILPVSFNPAQGPRMEPEVASVARVLDAADARKEALELQASGRWDDAVARLESQAEVLTHSAPNDAGVAAEAADLQLMASHLREDDFSAREIKYMKQQEYDARRSRSAASERIRRKE